MERELMESKYRLYLTKQLKELFPGCIVLKNDAMMHQGIPDLLVIFGDRWAMLEVKTSATACVRPNQKYWVDLLNHMSYANFIYPENEEIVLRELQSTFSS